MIRKFYLQCFSLILLIVSSNYALVARPASQPDSTLGNYVIYRDSFPNLEGVFAEFSNNAFQTRSELDRFNRINEVLLQLILSAPEESFLLPAAVDFIAKVNQQTLLRNPYHFSMFEFWLNQTSGLTDQENYAVRSKIAGKNILREDYQAFFPVGMDKTYNGTHIVVAHLSPDVDTMIASFLGWIDAFAARVGDARHLWVVPGGPPDSPAKEIMRELFGATLFSDVAITESSLKLSALDLITPISGDTADISSECLTINSDVEEMRKKINNQSYLTVVMPEGNNALLPLGVVLASTLQQSILGTVTFRDFCNLEEVKMAPYLTPISALDHHKSTLKTSTPPVVSIADVQSCTVLIAEHDFKINDRYRSSGVSTQQIDQDLQQTDLTKLSSQNDMRILLRLLQKRLALSNDKAHWVHPHRELAEYLCCLHAILDDTDLLTKVTKRDIDCVTELLNRVKSLTVKQDVEIVNLDETSRDKNYAKNGAKAILHNPEMYSFYRKISVTKEQELESCLQSSSKDGYVNLFADTKAQNGCCRIGQTKLFTINIPTFSKSQPKLIEYWYEKAQDINRKQPEIDLHMHMISTITSADEIYEDRVGQYAHQDQMWFWVPNTPKAHEHLASFMTAFQPLQKLGTSARFELLAGVSDEVEKIVKDKCGGVPCKKITTGPNLPVVVMYFEAGKLNSRKAMISPYLPTLGK